MLNLDFNLKGFSKTGLRWQRVLAERGQIAQGVLNDFAAEAVDQLGQEPYPPMLANQKYVRTYLLKNSYKWKARPLKMHGRVILSNDAPRRRFAIGKKSQVKIHQGRWYTMQDKVRGYTPDMHKALRAAYKARLTSG